MTSDTINGLPGAAQKTQPFRFEEQGVFFFFPVTLNACYQTQGGKKMTDISICLVKLATCYLLKKKMRQLAVFSNLVESNVSVYD